MTTAVAVARVGVGGMPLARARFAWASLAFGVCVFSVLVAVAGRYGYHRDELYFLDAGRHLAWGYPDQPPLVPLLARLMNDLAPGSVVVLRLPSAVVAAAIVPLTGAITRLLGGERGAQLLAAGSIAVSAVYRRRLAPVKAARRIARGQVSTVTSVPIGATRPFGIVRASLSELKTIERCRRLLCRIACGSSASGP